MKSLIKDSFVTLLLLSLFSWAAYKFYTDLNSQITHEGGEVIGEITFVKNSAQRKFSSRAVWGELETSAPVYNFDSLRTIEDSSAVIRLIDGTEITLAANTYIVLEWGEEEQSIEFLGGNISAERTGEAGSGTLQIKAEDTVIALDSASVTLDKKEGEELGLSVGEGAIDITKGNETRSVEENFRASIGDDIMVEQDAVTLKTPANNRLLVTTSASVPVTFTWERNLPLEEQRLEISEYSDFRSVERYEPDPGTLSYDLTTLPGTYHWRIAGKYSDGTPYFSSANRTVIIRDNAPNLQVPEMDEEFQFRKTPPDMAFSWEAAQLSNTSRLQVASEPGFSSMITDLPGSNNFHTLRELPEGEYYWRVIPEYTAADLVAYSAPEIRRFRVVQDETVDPPFLILPADEEQVNPLKTKEGLRFSWRADREIGSYHLTVARDAAMTDPIADQWINRNSWLMETLPEEGDYYWQVDGLDRENKQVPPSGIRRFSVLEAVIYIRPVKPAADDLMIVESYDSTLFSWDSSLEGPYRVELYRQENALLPLLTQDFRASPGTIPLPGPGEYYWQAGVLDSEGDTVINSEQVPFRMVQRLLPPEISRPLEEESLSIVGDNSLDILWQPVPGASYYSVYLKPDNPSNPSLKQDRLTAPAWRIDDKRMLRADNYTLNVQAHQELEEGVLNSSRPSQIRFGLDRVQSYGQPRLIYPAEGQQLSQLTILEQQPSFRWSQTPPLPRQQLRLSTDPGFATMVLDEKLESLVRPIPDLPVGTYYLQILSEDTEENPGPPSPVYSFQVTPIPDLPLPAVQEPRAGEVIDMEVRNDISFRWLTVAGADYYTLSMFRNDSVLPLFREEKLTTTQYTFNKLEELDVGSFRIEIQAVREKEGDVLQQSPVVTVPFELTLPEITELPEILSPELQYAR